MFAELRRQREVLKQRQSRRETLSLSRKARLEQTPMNEDPFASTECDSPARSDEDAEATMEPKSSSIFDLAKRRSLKAPQKTRDGPGRRSLSQEREQRLRSRTEGRKTEAQRNKEELASEKSLTTSEKLFNQELQAEQEDEDDEEEVDRLCEIITTEATRKLEGVPKSARPVRNAAELRRLLEEINLSHLPRSQTKFVVWYQTKIGGVFYKEPVRSVHQSLKSAYFRLKSGTVLKFNRSSSGK